MEMTIDEAIRYYEDKNVVLTEEEALANTIVINTMRKYQRIEQIVNGNINGAYSNIAEIRRIINGDNSTDGKKLC